MRNSVAVSGDRYLVFRLKSLLFALKILSVEDVVELDPSYEDTNMARQLAATSHTSVPVVDLRPTTRTRVDARRPDHSEHHFVIVVVTEHRQRRCVLGFVADRNAEIVELDATDVLISTERRFNGPASWEAKLGAKTVRLLDMEKVLQYVPRPKPQAIGLKKWPCRSTVWCS